MNHIEIEERQIPELYLRGKLSPDEAAAFEEHYLHCQECLDRLELADTFLQPFARACIDAGADAFLLAGPHVLRGIEMYKGKPIWNYVRVLNECVSRGTC